MRQIMVALAAVAAVAFAMAGSTISASAGYDRARVQHPPGWHGTGIWHGYHPRYPYYPYYRRYYGFRGHGPWHGYYPRY
jgi:hypothetical protein